MYESPITLYMSNIKERIEEQQAEQLMISVKQSIGYAVDKLELIKALQYDREQYHKGYRDSKSDMLDKLKQAREEMEIASYSKGYDEVFEILDKLIESER